MQQKTFRSKDMRRARTFATALLVTGLWLSGLPPTHADETCMSPYMAKITGQEDVVYVWTLGAEGVGDGSDKLVTVDVRPTSPTYGKVVHTASVGGRHEAHHAGFTDDRRYLWAGGLDTSQIFVFDIHSDPSKPRLVKTLTDFVAKSGGVVGPHTFYALPGRMLITGLSNDKDHGGRTALVEYTNEENTSPRTGCPLPRTRAAQRLPRLPMAMAMTCAPYRARTSCSPRRLPAGPIT